MRCLGLEKEPEGSYICIECIDGKTILYGDIVWVKIGVYRYVLFYSRIKDSVRLYQIMKYLVFKMLSTESEYFG